MPIDTEPVGQREGHRGAGGTGLDHGPSDDLLGTVVVPEVPLDVDDPGIGDLRRIDVVGLELRGDAEIGVESALRVRRDEHQAPGRAVGGLGARGDRSGERHAGSGDVVGEHLAEFVVGHLADESHRRTERGESGGGVGRGSPRDLDGGRHRRVERERGLGVDEAHGPLDHGVGVEERIVGVREHVDDRVTDAHDVERSPGRGWEHCHAQDPTLAR